MGLHLTIRECDYARKPRPRHIRQSSTQSRKQRRAALAPPAAGGAGLLARSPFADLAAAAASLVPPAAGGMGPLFRCSRRAFPAAAALAPPAAGGAGSARSPSPVLLLVESPAELPLSPRSAAGLATALLSCLATPRPYLAMPRHTPTYATYEKNQKQKIS